MNFKILFTFICLTLIIISCSKDETDDMNNNTTCDTTNLSYTNGISVILNSCASVGCHQSGSFNGSMSNYTEVVAFVNSQNLLGAIKHESGVKPMPQGQDKLSDCNIEKVETWIGLGMPE
jgi:hypothetical protein